MRTAAPASPRLTLALVAVALLSSASVTAQIRARPLAPLPPPLPGLEAPTPARESGPALVIGALLPLSGDSAPFGKEMRQGMELASAELGAKAPPRSAEAKGGDPVTGGAKRGDERTPRAEAMTPSDGPGAAQVSGAPERNAPAGAGAPAEAPKSDSAPPVLRIVLDFVDVDSLDIKAAERGFAKVTAGGAGVVFTASPTPTLAVLPLAAARDVLVLHLGTPSGRLPGASRTLLQVRPSPAVRVAGLVDYAWERGIRRLAVVSGGDDFGKAVRAALVPRWRSRGVLPVADESLTVEAADLRSRLGRIARQAPEAVCLAFRGLELASLAVALREVGYAGLILTLDDDRATLLAAGPTLQDMVIVSDAFVAEPEPAAAFAKAYQAKYNQAPSRFAATAYDAVRALAAAARSGPDGRLLARGGQLRAALVSRGAFESVFGGELAVKDDGVVERPLAVFNVTAGQSAFVRYVKGTR
jgi:ABC-type branched-subunit amino acid transport system substrate-binding protein